MIEEISIGLTAPEIEIANLKVRPEMACRVSMRGLYVLRSSRPIFQPLPRIVLHLVIAVALQKLDSLRPQRRYTLRTIININVEAVCLVVVLHPGEHIIVDIAKEVDVGLHTPVVVEVCERGMLREKAGIPATHLVIRGFFHVLHFLFSKEGDGFGVEIHVYPGGYFPVLFRD